MKKLALAFCAAVTLLSGAATAAVTPAILTSDDNRVPACVKPERMMEFLRGRNKKLNDDLGEIAALYKQHGEELGVRWDYAFYQMIVETNWLSYKTGGGKWGDVKPAQYNFAGLGATGHGAPGESFADVSTGVAAHLGHIRLYSGNPLENPAAQRTKLVEDIILPWAQGFDRPVTFTDLTTKWSPTDKGYSDDIETVAKAYRAKFCTGNEPEEEVAAAKPDTDDATASVETASAEQTSDETGATSEKDVLAKKKMGLGVNPDTTADISAKAQESAPKTEVAALNLPKPSTAGACKVFTASYGGSKTILIASKADGLLRYTALSVHDGKETAQAQAFINVYAKGGETVGSFATEDEALAKAFELCPEN
ncbi:MAG: glucosaminidase domain-containing protein [Hyphomicrobiaceae bacterium]